MHKHRCVLKKETKKVEKKMTCLGFKEINVKVNLSMDLHSFYQIVFDFFWFRAAVKTLWACYSTAHMHIVHAYITRNKYSPNNKNKTKFFSLMTLKYSFEMLNLIIVLNDIKIIERIKKKQKNIHTYIQFKQTQKTQMLSMIIWDNLTMIYTHVLLSCSLFKATALYYILFHTWISALVCWLSLILPSFCFSWGKVQCYII